MTHIEPVPFPADLRAVIFDKDGTLVDFHDTWDGALGRTLEALLGDDLAAKSALAAKLGFDLEAEVILDGAPFVSESAGDLFAAINSYVDPQLFESKLIAEGAFSAQPMVGASQILDWLRARNVKVGVATNDGESSAVAQLENLGWGGLFDAVVGYDSGFRSKPSPQMITGCCSLLGVEPEQTVMVGDTATDMRAARSAGVFAIAIGDDRGARSLCDAQITGLGELINLIKP